MNMIYTQCPSCKTTYRVSVKELRSGRGEVLCQECQVAFNALNALAEEPREAVSNGNRPARLPVLDIHHAIPIEPSRSTKSRGFADDDLPSMSATPPGKSRRVVDWTAEDDAIPVASTSIFTYLAWGLGNLTLVAMIVLQVFLFEGRRLAQNPELRPWLELTCDTLKCTLPDFHATADIQILNRSLHPTSDDTDGLEFNLVIANQSPLPQAFPAIKLSLTGTGGQTLQSRIFKPADYLADNALHQMPVGKPFQVRLLLARPETEVAGFIFDLI